MKNIVVLATGGTIAGAGSGGYGYSAGQFKVEDLIAAVPGIANLAHLRGEQVANIGSQHMNDEIWFRLAGRVGAALAEPAVDGVVITHGTDTLEETSYFLNLVVQSDKPVAFVGSMRPATAIGADGPANLYNAVAAAVSPRARGRGVLVVFNDGIHASRNVTKTNTTNVDTFESPNRGPMGVVQMGTIHWFEPTGKRHTTQSEFTIAGRRDLPDVEIIYAHANMGARLIEAAVDGGAKGLVIAGVGQGNVSQPALDALAKAAREGVAVVRSTRLPRGLVLRNNEIDDDALGFIASGELNPCKSRVLLQLALLEPRDPTDIQRIFDEY